MGNPWSRWPERVAGIGRGSQSSIEGKRGGNLGKYHTSDCCGDQQPVSHDSSLSRLQPVAWVLEGFHCYSQSRGGNCCWLTGVGTSEDKRQRKFNSTGSGEWRDGPNEHLKVKQAVSFDIAPLLLLILPVHLVCRVGGRKAGGRAPILAERRPPPPPKS